MKGKQALILMAGVLAFCALLLTVCTASSAESGQLHINLKEDDVLLPETKGDPDAGPQSMVVEALYEESLFSRYNRDWVDVGTWTSSSRVVDCEISGTIYFNVWFQIIDEGYSADPEFRYTLSENGNQICLLVGVGEDPENDDVIELMNDTAISQRTLEKDSTLELYIEYLGWEDCRFYYDNATYDAGFKLETDFLHLFDMEAGGEEVTLEVYDPFHSDWNEVKHYLELEVDGSAVKPRSVTTAAGEDHTVKGEKVTGTLITWKLDQELDGGEAVEAWVKYTRAEDGEDKGLKKTVTAQSGDKKRPVADIKQIKPSPADEGQEVSFDASDSSDQDGTVDVYIWKSDKDGELYNGSEALFKTPSLSADTHTITLVVQDNDGLWSAEETRLLTINPNTKPEIELTYPTDGETVTTTFTTLEWEGDDEDDDDLDYDVYLDTKQNPDTMVAEGITREDHDVEELEGGETYYW